MNNVILLGRLVYDLELKTFDNGGMLVDTVIAVNRKTKNSEGKYEADFINVVISGKIAETVFNYFKKGDAIGIIGELRTNSWTDKEGKKRNKTFVRADRISFISGGAKADKQEENKDPFEEFSKETVKDNEELPF